MNVLAALPKMHDYITFCGYIFSREKYNLSFKAAIVLIAAFFMFFRNRHFHSESYIDLLYPLRYNITRLFLFVFFKIFSSAFYFWVKDDQFL